MKADNREQNSSFNFPVLLILTAILCLVSYQAFNLNTALGVATASTALTYCVWRRRDRETPASEAN